MHSRQGGDRQLLVAQIHGFVGRINSKLASIDEEGPVKFFLDVNVQVSSDALITILRKTSVQYL
jgi:hypothetical protein